MQDREMESNQAKQIRGKKTMQTENKLSNSSKHKNIHIIWITKQDKRKYGAENLFEKIIAENFPNLEKETNPDPADTNIPKQINPKKSTPRQRVN